MKTRKMGYVKWIIAAVLLLVVAFSATSFMAQRNRMQERQVEKQQLLEKQEELELEKSRLELLSQYIGTEEYSKYYARYRLGYISPDEILFEK